MTLTDKQIIDIARECGFMVYEDGEKEVLQGPLAAFARRVEQVARGGAPIPRVPPTTDTPRAA